MSYTRSYFHIVFSTKKRQRTIPLDRRERINQYISGVIKNKNCEPIKVNGIEDHIHILLNLHPTVALADIVRLIKQSSSKMITQTFCCPMWEGWESEYFASSVSPSHVEKVKEYIIQQEEHHKGKDFGSEAEEFVRKMGMEMYRDGSTSPRL